MLTYKNDTLTLNNVSISKADTIIKLASDIDAEFYAIVTLANNVTKTIQFIKENTYYKSRLVFTEEDLPYLTNVNIQLVCVSSIGEKHSNKEKLNIDTNKVRLSVKLKSSSDILSIQEKLAKLTSTVNDILNNSVVYKSNLNIEQKNILPGMIPVAINSEGLCMFKYPFVDIITEINGQKTVNNAIIISAKDIPIADTDVESAVKGHTEAIKTLNDLLQTISKEVKSIKNKLAKVEKDLLTHTDSSLV